MSPRPQRRFLTRTAPAFLLLVAAVMAVAQLAGVAGSGSKGANRLVFDGTHEAWLVQMPATAKHPKAKIGRAARALGGGTASDQLPGGWYEVELGNETAAAMAEAAFTTAGAIDVEPALPRLPYVGDEPDSGGATPTPQAAEDEPAAVSDTPGALGHGTTTLRNGPIRAPRLGEQWALTQESNVDINGPEAWQTTTGAGAVVAVIDTGIDATHPDLVGRVLPGMDFSGSTTGPQVDKVGHGTAVASLIAAGGVGMAGVAPDAKVLPLKVFRDSDTAFSMGGYLAAIRYAADQGVDVINISLGCGGTTSCFSQAELDAVTYAADKGVLIVAAAGNGDRSGQGLNNDGVDTPDYPSGYDLPAILSVTASTRLGNWSPWANYGVSSVDIAAPGEGILVAAPGGSYRALPGTSFSAPIVSGAAALLAATNQGIAPEDIRARLLATARPATTLANRTVSGGVLDAQAALSASAIGGGNMVITSTARAVSPRAGARVGTPPVMTWQLPSGWKSTKVIVRYGTSTYTVPVAAARRAVSHPAKAWRSGLYRWQVVATTPSGTSVTTPARAYTVAPRVGAWVTSGRLREAGRTVRLRVGYASSELRATTKVSVAVGKQVLHTGKATSQGKHVRGTGSPRRGWISYDARLSRSVRVGERVTVTVRVASGRTVLTRRFTARVY
ncbi:MAG: putative subtilase-family protease [Thermoleophilia bacterium]|nr:putative subtilase-family protease [Thermoleophilia bacterium]